MESFITIALFSSLTLSESETCANIGVAKIKKKIYRNLFLTSDELQNTIEVCLVFKRNYQLTFTRLSNLYINRSFKQVCQFFLCFFSKRRYNQLLWCSLLFGVFIFSNQGFCLTNGKVLAQNFFIDIQLVAQIIYIDKCPTVAHAYKTIANPCLDNWIQF